MAERPQAKRALWKAFKEIRGERRFKQIRNSGTDGAEKSVEVYKKGNGKQGKALKNINIHEKILELKNEIEMKFIKLGGYLKLVNDRKLYIEKGCQTFNEYLAMPELGFQRSTAYAIMGVYSDFIESGKIQSSDMENMSYYRLDRIRQFKDDEDIDEWIEKAKVLSLSDLNEEIKIAKGKEKKEYILERKVIEVVCPKCGAKFGVNI